MLNGDNPLVGQDPMAERKINCHGTPIAEVVVGAASRAAA